MENKAITLRESVNNMVVVGKLKSKEFKYGSKDGISTIGVTLKVLTTEKLADDTERVHENTIRLWAKQTSKLYSSYVTVANEYKSIEEVGEAAADVIRITGSLEMNEYEKNGEIKTNNNLRGVFVNRVQDPKLAVQEVGAEVECVVLGIADEMKDSKLSGRKKIQVMSVGYGSRIHELQNVVVESNLAEQFARTYKVGDTAKFIFKVNRYAEVKKDEPKPDMALGFGTGLSNTFGGVTDNYVNDLVIVGGTLPYAEGIKYSNEQIAEMRKIRELAKNELINSAAAAPSMTAQTGFGAGFGTGFDVQPDATSNVNQTPAGVPPMDDMPF